MPDFTHRASGIELMDDLDASGVDLRQALRELEAINYLLGGNYVTLNGIDELLNGVVTREDLHIADLGCGSGDMLKLIRKLLDKRRTRAVLTGIDANAHVIGFASRHTPHACAINYRTLNIFSPQFKTLKFDIVTATLFFHHFTTERLVELFRQLKSQASVGLVINDIHRHWFSYYSIKWLTGLFSRSVMVKHDGPMSVLRAFKKRELLEILRQAGIAHYRIRWCWAFRWQLIVWFNR
jgi:2-polyprenyl-3-methyl-5-hydroxy-6-metoxy-1,4-benzoquinol methylase